MPARTRRFLWILGGIALLGVLLRLAFAFELLRAGNGSLVSPLPATDMRTYRDLSEAFLHGGFSGRVFYYQPFYYTVFLPFFLLIFQAPVWAAIAGQTLCSAGIIWFAGLTGALLRGRKTGLLAAVLAAFSTLLVFYTPFALIEVPQAFHFILLAYLLIRNLRRDSLLFWCFSGVILAFAILSRGSAWCFLPVALYAVWRAGRRHRASYLHMLRNGVLLFVFALLPQLPFIVHNSRVTGSFTGPSTAGPAVLAIGNNPESAPGFLRYPKTYEVWMAEPGRVVRRIFDWAEREPGAFGELQFRKLLLFWDAREIPNNVSPEVDGKGSLALPFAFAGTSLLLLLTLFFFGFEFRRILRKGAFAVLSGMILFYWPAVSAFYLLARFRVPILGVLCVSSACAIFALSRIFRRKNFSPRRLLTVCVILLVSGWIVYFSYGVWQYEMEPALARQFRPRGVELQVSDHEMEAQDHSPLLFDNRVPVELKPGSVLEKTFSPRDTGLYDTATLGFELFSDRPGSMEIEVNGEACTLEFKRPVKSGLPFYLAEVSGLKCPDDREFRIRVISGAALLLTDPARNYGRTRLDGAVLAAEACVRLNLKR